MRSKLAEAVKLRTQPVAILWTDDKPDQALQFSRDQRGCVISMLIAAAMGQTAVFDSDTCGCGGGRVGLGFGEYDRSIAEFLSTGGPEGEGERYKKTPQYAWDSIQSLPDVKVPTEFVVFKPLDKVDEAETPEAVVFLVNADQLSGLVTLANFDRPTRDNVILEFGAGCHSTVLQVIHQGRLEHPRAVVGLTDPSARLVLPGELLSFGVPFSRFLELEGEVCESFFTTPTWATIAQRL